MNFEFDINPLLPHEVTKFNSSLRIVHPEHLATDDPSHYQLSREMRQKVAHVIDRMGEASSRAQGLREVITSCRKLNLNDQHRIYLMKDPAANNGKGSMVGFLKVGEKNLFLHDHQGQSHEIMSLCVLDFYVYDNQQRRGYGLKLFNKMLEMERVFVQHLAIDSPSDKSMRFLKKHYDLKSPINQTNSYVVFSGFFDRPNLLNRYGRRFNSAQVFNNELPPLDNKVSRNDTLDNIYNSNNSWSSQTNQASKFFQNKSANVADERNRNIFKSELEIKANRYDSFMEANFANRHKHDPFPSLNPFNNRTNVNTKQIQSSEKRTLNQNSNNPFPSLNMVKPNVPPDLYTNQFYMNSKFRRTKLW